MDKLLQYYLNLPEKKLVEENTYIDPGNDIDISKFRIIDPKNKKNRDTEYSSPRLIESKKVIDNIDENSPRMKNLLQYYLNLPKVDIRQEDIDFPIETIKNKSSRDAFNSLNFYGYNDIKVAKKYYKNLLEKDMFKYYFDPFKYIKNDTNKFNEYTDTVNVLNRVISKYIKNLSDGQAENTIRNIIEMTMQISNIAKRVFSSFTSAQDIYMTLNKEIMNDPKISIYLQSGDKDTNIILENIISYVNNRIQILGNTY
jgi:hypothetical protein